MFNKQFLFLRIFGWEKNKLISKQQTKAVEFKNAIKIFLKSVSDFTRGGGGSRPSQTILTFGKNFFLGRPLRENTKLQGQGEYNTIQVQEQVDMLGLERIQYYKNRQTRMETGQRDYNSNIT